ncbi:hypothetical protein HMPREF9318_01919 [Streptococcus urinalis FB127-CNA-2]|uniref:Transcriptional regulator, RpiR family n=1 Tax=Streptococcus urinalis 2285-97 TaxID=764291 RepID=G5KDB5_9STRE|nr:MurR/RpiR family transcriptional regulator [Streptococcus urinalis]EHJ56603.1 transcriptional regulator, RpiR family [Streptococcus urinalis 2285-97]EKS17470.1 hypothetical protein HMPREF9318_01919 [Streptococcus urinalis FB127-CNA-2]VEF32708.1 RpiR family transcriptional regulator [Streptococcus urinalis]
MVIFSKAEFKVYQYLQTHLDDVEIFTISKLANVCHTSTSAVLRFCQTLGYKGYKDFRFDVTHYLHHQQQKNSEDITDHMIDQYATSINQLKKLDRQQLDHLISVIRSGSKIHIVGIFHSSLPARLLHIGLQDLGMCSSYAGDLNAISHLTNIIDENDILIDFSISGLIENYRYALSALSHNMPKESFLITLNPNAQVKKYYQKLIVLPGISLSKESIVDIQSISIMFVELLLNRLHSKLD